MSFKNNRGLILLLDFLLLGLCAIPILAEKITRRKSLLNPRRILIIELWGIGDLVMMSPILMPLKEHFPKARIILLSRDYGETMFGFSGYINQFVRFDFPWIRFKGKYRFWNWNWKGLIEVIYKLRKEKFDIVLDARGDLRNNLLSFLTGAKKRMGYGWTGGGYFLTDNLGFRYKSRHRVDAWMNLLVNLGIAGKNFQPQLFIDRETDIQAENFLKENGIRDGGLLIGIHPGAGIKTRCWPLDRFAEVAEYFKNKYKAKIIVFVDKDGFGESIHINGEWVASRVQLRLLIGLIKRINLLICNDSAAMHIATATNCPVVAIFGPGDLGKIGPRGERYAVVLKEAVSCRPCFDYCKFNKPSCIEQVTIDDVIQATENLMEKLQFKLQVSHGFI